MRFVHENGIAMTAILLAPMLLGGAGLFVAALKRYEIAFLLIMVSPWAHWILGSNEELSVMDAAEETGPATYFRLGLVVFAGGVGWLKYLEARRAEGERLPPRFALLGLFFVGGLLSTVYSIAGSFTFVRSCEALIFLGFLLGLQVWLKDEETLDRMLNLTVCIVAAGLLVNLASLAVLPGRAWWWQAPNRFQGLMGQPNEMGMFCMSAYPLLMWRTRRSGVAVKGAILALFLAALGMHGLSGSRSSFVCAVVGFAVWHTVLRQRMKLALLGAAVLAGAALAASSAIPSLERDESEELTDLTGRPEFWRNGIEVFRHRPLTGYGYQVSGMVWSDPRFATAQLESSWSTARASLHNGYLDTLIGLGAIGLALWVIVLAMPLPRVLRLPRSDYKALALATVLPFLLLNFVETLITSSRSYGSIVFWCFWVLCGSLPAVLREEASVPDETSSPAWPADRKPADGAVT